MHAISTRRGRPPLATTTIVSALYTAFLFTPSLASAHAIASDRVFPSTMAVDDPGVGDEANLQLGTFAFQETTATRASIPSTSNTTN